MANVKNNLKAIITMVDSGSAQPFTRDTGTLQLDSNGAAEFCHRAKSGTAGADQTIDFPGTATVVTCVYIKNIGTGVLTIKGTPQGAAEVTLTKLEAGGVFIVWNITAGGSPGYTTLKVNPSVNDTEYEYYLAA
jgi:hypothetical protein